MKAASPTNLDSGDVRLELYVDILHVVTPCHKQILTHVLVIVA